HHLEPICPLLAPLDDIAWSASRSFIPFRHHGSVFRDINIGKGHPQGEADPLRLASSACVVLCLNLGITTTFQCRRKSKPGLETARCFECALPELYVSMCSNR